MRSGIYLREIEWEVMDWIHLVRMGPGGGLCGLTEASKTNSLMTNHNKDAA